MACTFPGLVYGASVLSLMQGIYILPVLFHVYSLLPEVCSIRDEGNIDERRDRGRKGLEALKNLVNL